MTDNYYDSAVEITGREPEVFCTCDICDQSICYGEHYVSIVGYIVCSDCIFKGDREAGD